SADLEWTWIERPSWSIGGSGFTTTLWGGALPALAPPPNDTTPSLLPPSPPVCPVAGFVELPLCPRHRKLGLGIVALGHGLRQLGSAAGHKVYRQAPASAAGRHSR